MHDSPSYAEQLYNNWKTEIDYAIKHLIIQEPELVNALKQHAAMTEDDIKQECLLKILTLADWIIEKNWINQNKNPQGFFYRIARNKLIDLWRKYETKGNIPHINLEEAENYTIQPLNNNTTNKPNPNTLNALKDLHAILHELLQQPILNIPNTITELAKEIFNLETILKNKKDPTLWNNYQQHKQIIKLLWLT